MEIFLFTLNAIVIYFIADWLLRMIETRRGSAMPYRQLVFFAIFLTLAVTSFGLLRTIPAM